VRETETLVKRLASPPAPRAPKAEGAKDVHTRAAEDRLRFALGTKVRILRGAQGGTIEISFGSEAELNRIYEQITDVR
jgi:ParB-like chromosome segregation protein Spo0J